MDTVKARRLKPYERLKLHGMKRQLSNQVNSRHARIILLSVGGLTNRQIAERADCSGRWVREIIHRFNDGGIEAITWYPIYRCGRGQPRKFEADVVEQIAEVALSPPEKLIGMNEWSLPKLRDYLVKQEVVASISLEHLRTLLKRRKVRLRRTQTWKESTDPDFWRKYRAIRRLYRHPPAGGRVICVDEFGPLNLQPRPGQCYKGPGKPVKRFRATYNRNLGVRHFLAYYDLKMDRLYGYVTRQKKTPDFLKFMKWLRNRYPRQQILHVVLDNYGTHDSDALRDWAVTSNVRLYFTPTNASWLNRIESHFTALRKFALNCSDYRSHEQQEAAIRSYLQWRNRKRDISVADYSKTRKSAA